MLKNTLRIELFIINLKGTKKTKIKRVMYVNDD